MGLALNNLQRLIGHKTQPTNIIGILFEESEPKMTAPSPLFRVLFWVKQSQFQTYLFIYFVSSVYQYFCFSVCFFLLLLLLVQSAGATEYTDCTSAE